MRNRLSIGNRVRWLAMRSAAHFFIRWGLLASIVFLLSGCRTPKAGTPPEYGLSIENARVVYNRTSNTVSYSLELVNNSGSARRVAWTDATTNPLTSFILHNADSGDEFVLNRTPSTSYYFAMEPFVIRPGKRKILSGQDQIDTKRSRLYFWRWDSSPSARSRADYALCRFGPARSRFFFCLGE